MYAAYRTDELGNILYCLTHQLTDAVYVEKASEKAACKVSECNGLTYHVE